MRSPNPQSSQRYRIAGREGISFHPYSSDTDCAHQLEARNAAQKDVAPSTPGRGDSQYHEHSIGMGMYRFPAQVSSRKRNPHQGLAYPARKIIPVRATVVTLLASPQHRPEIGGCMSPSRCVSHGDIIRMCCAGGDHIASCTCTADAVNSSHRGHGGTVAQRRHNFATTPRGLT